MSSHPFAKPTLSQRARIARRRKRSMFAPDSAGSESFSRDLQHIVNTQMNGIIGLLEMLQQTDLTSDQRSMLGVMQNSAENLLSDVARFLTSEAGIDSVADPQNFVTDVRMLLLDPDADSNARTANALLQRGARIDRFFAPDDALAALSDAAAAGAPYRIALLNQQLPGTNGETLGIAIGSDPLYRDTLIVLISDMHGSHDANRLAQAGFSGWLPKPLSHIMLFDTVAMLCGCLARKDAPRFIDAGIRLAGNHAPDTLPFTHRRILVVDDNPVNLQVAKRMLTRLGCHVDTADGSQQALAQSDKQNDEQRYDLILLDCQMPQHDGYQTAALLRAAESGKTHTPIVGWSASASRNERDICLASGMDDFIAKPLRIRQLSDLLTRWLSSPIDAADSALARQDNELEATQQMLGDDFSELVHLFLADSPQRIASLRDAIAANDAAVVAKLAHTLCGSFASIGASALAALCRELEVRARNDRLDDAASRIDAITGEYARIENKLRAML